MARAEAVAPSSFLVASRPSEIDFGLDDGAREILGILPPCDRQDDDRPRG